MLLFVLLLLLSNSSLRSSQLAKHSCSGQLLKRLFPTCSSMVEVVRAAGERRENQRRETSKSKRRKVNVREEVQAVLKRVVDTIVSREEVEVGLGDLLLGGEGAEDEKGRKRSSEDFGSRTRRKGGGEEDDIKEVMKKLLDDVVSICGSAGEVEAFNKLGLKEDNLSAEEGGGLEEIDMEKRMVNSREEEDDGRENGGKRRKG